MIDNEKLINVLYAYKEHFPIHWKDEDFKWKAIQHFRDHWDINALDFAGMFETATAKAYSLLAAGYFYPRGMIINFAKADPEATRAMFINLFDESKNLSERVDQFQTDAEKIKIEHDDGTWKNHYQNTNSISTYLWLRYPDKYYIYKYSICFDVAKVLKSDFLPKKSSSSDVMVNAFKFYDEVCGHLQEDVSLRELLNSYLTKDCYPDSELRTMTIDVGHFISKYYNKDVTEWFPSNYSPNLSVKDWISLLEDEKIFTTSSLEIMKRINDFGGMTTCKQLSKSYGENINFYKNGSSALAKRIATKTGCPIMQTDEETLEWWPILYLGKKAEKDNDGSYIWKLRDELKEALGKVDLSKIKLHIDGSEGKTNCNYWWLNANPKIWSFSNLGVGETQSYTLYNDNGNKRHIFQNFLDAKSGDIIIGYESTPVKQIVALAKVTQEQDGESLYFEKFEGLSIPIDYQTLKSCPELKNMEFFVNPNGSLFKLSKDEYDFIMDVIRENNPVIQEIAEVEEYTKEDFLYDVYMTEEKYDTLTSLLKNKKNLILQGAPGVGKTFTAKRLAYAMMGRKDDSRVEFIQFHQNYSYEDFIMGYRPQDEGFKLTNGIFYRFCQNAANNPKKDFFFIIDEINRGNMSKIFGELLMLIEADYRGAKATLAYNGMLFSVPNNLYLIGMMNTADRSLAMIDYALRRRFSFFEMDPGFNSEGFKAYQATLNNVTFNTLIEKISDLNKEIAMDSSLGKAFRIGHSYFCGKEHCTEEWMKQVVYYDIIPMLSEYWFDEPQKLLGWENTLSGVFNDYR